MSLASAAKEDTMRWKIRNTDMTYSIFPNNSALGKFVINIASFSDYAFFRFSRKGRIPNNIMFLALISLFLQLLIIPSADAEGTFYVNYAVNVNGDGTDWNNAFTQLPSQLVRGCTYFIADGTYGNYTFDDTESGATNITIKKATQYDHGTDVGWKSKYGDGQAVFGKITFTTDNWIFNGQARNSNDWSSESHYGFVVDGGAGGYNAKLFDVSYADNIKIQYVYAFFDNIKTGSDVSANRDHGLYSLENSNYISMEYCKLENISWKAAILINNTAGPISVRYNYFENIWKKETFSARSTDNVTFAFNYIKNAAGTGIIVADSSDSWNIYGNIFWSPNSSYSFSDVIIGTWTGDHSERTETLNSWKIYNNIFYQMNGATKIEIQKGSHNEVKNNLFVGFTSLLGGSLVSENNSQNVSSSVLTDKQSGDFRLTSSTLPGSVLGSPYDKDMLGNIRGSDGLWDRGAIEYATSTSPLSAPLSLRVVQR